MNLVEQWNQQDTDDRGMAWAIGCILTSPSVSYILSGNDVTVILGQHSASGETQYDAVVNLVKSYGYDYELPQRNELEDRLNELGLLE